MPEPDGSSYIVQAVVNIAAARHFYQDLLGFRLSDVISMQMAPQSSFEMEFFHCNARHHSLALVPLPAPRRLHHFMIQSEDQFVEKVKRWRGDLSGGAAGIVKPTVTLEPQLSVAASGAPGDEAVRFDVRFTTKSGAGVDASTVVRAWQEGLGIVPLTDGGWASYRASKAALNTMMRSYASRQPEPAAASLAR